ncbi:MAG: LacI family DNA-binding transcriptional regulator [Clostridiales bacterium]|uniref:PfkB family carbohydrate kinase n=1 Tax=Provencibacterium massiliense TaxID=1841868 RepID=UPI0009A85EB3|nr:PfkB family carbohydrate kinase [Provencibacterium massiliense]PWM40366.1 MAG: LacI family DNA-binding transcriptional regulator [Clostridiales bacterium]RGB69701.1 LacI family DNA-binding transcriptional regulator [Harryflintia acetispora]
MNIKDIAKLAGVSAATVSKIINHKDAGISPETRERVQKLVKEYQYTPYAGVKAEQNSYTIALLSDFDSPAHEALMRGTERALSENGYSLLVLNLAGGSERELKSLQIASSRNLNGVIFLGSQSPCAASIEALRKLHLPVMLLGVGEKVPRFLQAGLDVVEAAYLGVRQLVQQGHERIGCLVEGDGPFARQVLDGYIYCCYERKLRFDTRYVYRAFSGIENGKAGLEDLVRKGVTALFCQNEEIAAGVYQAAEIAGLSIPEDLSVACLTACQRLPFFHPALCAVRLPVQELGEYAARCLIEWIERGDKTGLQPFEAAAQLLPGGSVAAPKQSAKARQKIVVVGSMNMDVMIRVPDFPRPGETVLSPSVNLVPGGKGANQAAGVGKLGGNVWMIGKIGNDSEGKLLYQSLYDNNVNMDGVTIDDARATGKAYITVTGAGESTIVVYPGANGKLSAVYLRQNVNLFDHAKYCLLPTENPPEVIDCAIRIARNQGVRVIMKPAAVDRLDPQLLSGLFLLVPNEKEIGLLCPGLDTIEEKAKHFLKRGVENVIITLGERGCVLCNQQETTHFKAANFHPVDTTGAADCFIGALAVSLSEGNGLHAAIRFATFAAGLSITREGVQPALPDRAALSVYADEIYE